MADNCREKKALYSTISDNSISLAETAAVAFSFFLSFFFFFFLIMLTSLAFVSLCSLYGITNVKGVFLLRCDPPLLSRFSCCLLTVLSSVKTYECQVLHRHLWTS